MTASTARSLIEDLDVPSCWAILGRQSVGRIAYIADHRPMILPVNFVVVDDRVVFRSDPGDKLDHLPMSHVCFEVDGVDDQDHVWSVVVHGFIRDVTTALNDEYERLRQARVPTFTSLEDPHWLDIAVESISGRRLSHR